MIFGQYVQNTVERKMRAATIKQLSDWYTATPDLLEAAQQVRDVRNSVAEALGSEFVIRLTRVQAAEELL